MPAESKAQQRFFGMVRAEQKGRDTGSDEAKSVASDISPEDATDFAKTRHEGLPDKKESEKKSEAELSAFVTGFLDKAASMGMSQQETARAVYGICQTDCDAKDAFEQHLKVAMDLSSIPQATTPPPAPCRSNDATEDQEKARAKEVMMKKYASGFNWREFLETPVRT